MSITSESTSKTSRPLAYARPSATSKVAGAFVAMAVSSTLLGGVLGLFEQRSQDAAYARASVKTQPATGGVVMRAAPAAARG